MVMLTKLNFGDAISNEQYKSRLLDIYKSATKEEVDRRNIKDIERVIKYFVKLEEVKDMYRDFLLYSDVDIDSKNTVEIDVGVVDSVLKDNGATIITPYCGQFKDRKGLVYEGAHFVRNGEIEMVTSSARKFEIETAPLEIGKGRVYLTQNLLKKSQLNSYKLLSQNENNRVVLGVYGFERALDMEERLTNLEEFARQNGFKKEYKTRDNGICLVIKNR